MSLEAGTRLGPYEISAPIGAGGMGEVYRARDTRLGRDVAIKILPQHLITKTNAKQRFEREARAISSLQHPNICTLYDVGHQDGTDFLVMEYLEGETLSSRLAKGPLPPEQVLKIGIEICEGLETAHRSGVVHRDLKPGNVMLTKTGAKLLDFGLAKPLESAPAASLTALPTASKAVEAAKPVTAEGTIVGTFQYMSPEQLEGKGVDERSDIFSLGAVLYEMATGKRAFEGKSRASVIAAILEREPPPISSLQPMSPPQLDRPVKLCLAKDADERFQSAHDVKLQLEWIRDAGSHAEIPAPVAAHRQNRERIAWGAAGFLALVAVVLAYGFMERAPGSARAIISQLNPPTDAKFAFMGFQEGPPALSPDGQLIAFSAIGSDGTQRLWIKALDSTIARPLEGTEGARDPFWSPDSRLLGFFASGQLQRTEISGGAAVFLGQALAGSRGGSWGSDGTILFAPMARGALYRVPASGGARQAVTRIDASSEDTTHRWPQFLPDGKHFLFMVGPPDASGAGIYAGSLDGGDPKFVLRNDSNALYAPPGYLLYVRNGNLMAEPFNANRLQSTGDAVSIAEGVAIDRITGRAIFTTSKNGILAYQQEGGTAGGNRLLWYDRTGKQIGSVGPPGLYATVSLSPDGSKLAVSSIEPDFIWSYDLARGTRTRITFGSAHHAEQSWSPDGKYIACVSTAGNHVDIYRIAANGTGGMEPLIVDQDGKEFPNFSADGRYLIYVRVAVEPKSRSRIWALPLAGKQKAIPVVQGDFDAGQPASSPDGKWLAYVSAESGRDEVYLVPFPRGNGKWLVSTEGGSWPRWGSDGKELFYVSPQNEIMAAEILERDSSVQINKVKPLFKVNPGLDPSRFYDVSGDGKKFLVVTEVAENSSQPLTLVTNWPALLKKQ